MALTLSITERTSGVALSEDVVPSTPSLSPTVDTNELTVTWSQASGELPSEQIEFHTVLDDLGTGFQIGTLTITWGDGTSDTVVGGFGRSIDNYELHTYTGMGPFTISVEIFMNIPNDITFNETLPYTPQLSADYAVDQIQLEKYEDDVVRYAPDWSSPDLVGTNFNDEQVARGFRYKYRIRFRTLDDQGAPSVTSQFSALVAQNPWA